MFIRYWLKKVFNYRYIYIFFFQKKTINNIKTLFKRHKNFKNTLLIQNKKLKNLNKITNKKIAKKHPNKNQ